MRSHLGDVAILVAILRRLFGRHDEDPNPGSSDRPMLGLPASAGAHGPAGQGVQHQLVAANDHGPADQDEVVAHGCA